MMEDAVSEFIVSSCIVHPQPNGNRVAGLLHVLGRTRRDDIDISDIISHTLTGSASEFFIEPMLRCVIDFDIMYYCSHRLVVPTRHHVPRNVQLPVEFHNSGEIDLYEFVDIQIPCYVFMQLIGKLRKCESDDYYTFVPATVEYDYAESRYDDLDELHGPARVDPYSSRLLNIVAGRRVQSMFSADLVQCTRCLEWPRQSAEWLTRVRRYNCPDTATMQRVVGCGCDLVLAAHRRYKDDEWFRKRMSRFSFSRAETLLLNSWTPKQQIIYHVLRYVVKKAGYMEQSEQSLNGIFHNYHLKTMMLWSCEQQSPEWWSLPLVCIVTKLLHTLSTSITDGECWHYFIANCNLLDYLDDLDPSAVEFVMSTLATVTDESLSLWLANTYIKDCAQQCPDYVSCLMNNLNTTIELQDALTSIINWRVCDSMEQSARSFIGLLLALQSKVWESDLTIHSLIYPPLIEEIRLVDRRLAEFSTALILLQSTKESLHKPHNFKVIELVRTLLECEDSVNTLTSRGLSKSSNSLLTQGINILKKLKTTKTRSDTMLLIELAKAFFTESIINSDHKHQQHVQCLARVNLACLHYRTEQYQTAINQCLLVTKQCSSHLVDMQHLSNSDDDISVVSGLIAVYQFIIQRASSNQFQQTQHIGAVAAESCSFFLTIKCLSRLKSVDCKFPRNILWRHRKNLRKNLSLYIGDVLLAFVSVMKKSAVDKVPIYTRRSMCEQTVKETQLSRLETVRLDCLMMKSAVERLTRVRQAMSRDYIAVRTIVTTDYEAMYAYKCGEFEMCLRLCEQNVNKLQFVYKLSHVCYVPSSDVLLMADDDILSIVGLSQKLFERDDHSNSVNQITVLLYLLVQCKLQLRHSMTSLATVLRLVLCTFHRLPVELICDRLILAFVYRKARRTLHKYQSRHNETQSPPR